MRLSFLLVAALACTGEATAPPEPTPPPVQPPPPPPAQVLPDPVAPDVSAEVALLAKGSPPAGPVVALYQALATELGAGAVRCPLVGGGWASVSRGRASDHGITWGIPVGMEDGEQPPWSPSLDVAGSENDWATFLVAPGETTTTVRTKTRAVRYVHPVVAPGAVVDCTKVEPGRDRVVRGRIEAPRPPQILVMPCLATPPRVGEDGTFVAVVPTPCDVWVEGAGVRSESILVEPGVGPVDLRFHLEPDPRQESTGMLKPEGVQAVITFLEESGALDRAAALALDHVEASTAKHHDLLRPLISTMRTNLRDRQILTTKAMGAMKGEL